MYMPLTLFINLDIQIPEGLSCEYLWPMAMDHAVWIYNHVPNPCAGMSPNGFCSHSRFEPFSETLSDFHVCGCPTYVLDPKM